MAAVAVCWWALALAGEASGAPRAQASVGFQPVPLAVAAGAGHVYLSNPAASGQVERFTSDGTLVSSWGSFGWSAGSTQPRRVATDGAGNVYVADSRSGLLGVYTPDGVLVRQWKASVRDVAVGADGHVYAVGDSRVLEFDSDGSLLAMWGGPGEGDGLLGEPWGIDVGADGNVYVADTYSNRVEVFTADGALVTAWGSYGKGPGQFIFPYGIATDPAGNVYVADTAINRVQKFTAAGAFIAAWGRTGRGPGKLYTPSSVATDAAGNVYVADAGVPFLYASDAARVVKFTPDGQFLAEWHSASALPRPPRPRLLMRPGRRTASRAAVFRFRSRQPGVRLQCRLTGPRVPRRLRRWRRCASPKRYARLRPGRKIFHVRAVEGRVAGKPARHAWRILKAPRS